MFDIFKSNFDKFLLSLLFLLGLGLFIFLIYHTETVEAGVLQWLENLIGQILAALLTLSVGQRLTQRNGDPPPPVSVVDGASKP